MQRGVLRHLHFYREGSMKTLEEYLGEYAEGWTKGNLPLIFGALAPDYVLDDPNTETGKVPKEAFPGYFKAFKERVGSRNPFMRIDNVVTSKNDRGELVAWCWWSIGGNGTTIEGSGFITVGKEGVLSERIAYYTKLPS